MRAARPARRLPRHALGAPALPRRGDRPAAGDPGRTAQRRRAPRRCRPAPARHRPRPAAPSSPASASTPAARPRRARWPPGRTRPTGRSASTSAASTAACSQPNLTASWVAAQTEAGWHLIPTYVGLQAPTSACSQLRQAQRQPGDRAGRRRRRSTRSKKPARWRWAPAARSTSTWSPTARTSSATAATLAFLEAWTEKLHALGYVSGVYSSSASGIADLAGQVGTGYVLPDNLWIANWNGQADHHRPGRPRQRLDPAPAHPPVPRRPQRELRRGRRSTSTTTTSTARRSAPPTSPTTSDDPVGYARPGRLARPRPGAGQAAGPSTPTRRPNRWRSALYVGGRPGRPRRRRLRPRPGRQPRAPRRRRQVPAKPAPATASTSAFADRQVGAAAGLRLRAQHRRRQRPPARLQGDDDPGRGHASRVLKTTASERQGLGRLRMAGGDRLPGAACALAPGSRSPSLTVAARRRGSAPSPARSGAAPSSLTGGRATAS